MTRSTLIITAVLAVAAAEISAAPRPDPVARFSARSVQMSSPMRTTFPRVDIVINQWSTDVDHRALGRTVLERGSMAFSHMLAGYPRVGSIAIGDQEYAIRYAWQTVDRDGSQRVYLASDEPIFLMTREFRKFAEPAPMLFLELRLDARGDGIGKLSEATSLAVDESRNVIELREWDRRPIHLLMVHDEMNLVD